MTPTDALALLGLDGSETLDERSLKRAYLRATKSCPPERDPEGFARVRAAYELLLAKPVGGVPRGPRTTSVSLWRSAVDTTPATFSASVSDPSVSDPSVSDPSALDPSVSELVAEARPVRHPVDVLIELLYNARPSRQLYEQAARLLLVGVPLTRPDDDIEVMRARRLAEALSTRQLGACLVGAAFEGAVAATELPRLIGHIQPEDLALLASYFGTGGRDGGALERRLVDAWSFRSALAAFERDAPIVVGTAKRIFEFHQGVEAAIVRGRQDKWNRLVWLLLPVLFVGLMFLESLLARH